MSERRGCSEEGPTLRHPFFVWLSRELSPRWGWAVLAAILLAGVVEGL